MGLQQEKAKHLILKQKFKISAAQLELKFMHSLQVQMINTENLLLLCGKHFKSLMAVKKLILKNHFSVEMLQAEKQKLIKIFQILIYYLQKMLEFHLKLQKCFS